LDRRRSRGLGRLGWLRLGWSTSPWERSLFVSGGTNIQTPSRKDRLALDRVSTVPERLRYQYTSMDAYTMRILTSWAQ
jgi:hypothetical protein